MPTSSSAQVAAQMIAALALSEPTLDTSIGSVPRKMIDAFSEQIAVASTDDHLLNYQHDVDSKSGADLDDFVLTFGFSRLPAKRAAGVVTFTRPTAADQDYLIPSNTLISTGTTPNVVFATAAPATLFKGTTLIDVPVLAVVGGDAGNVTAGQLTQLNSAVTGVSASTANAAPTTGGTNAESDLALIARFKKTIFRSMAGTEDMFLAVALENTSASSADVLASQALVIGASRRWREQVQIAADGTATSTMPATNAKYIFPSGSFLGPSIDSGNILVPGVHYTFDNTVIPPRVVRIGTGLAIGSVYDLDFEYTPMYSRNDPVNGITNRIDIWVNGKYPVQATETAYLRTARVFSATSTNALYVNNFVRRATNGTHPTAGNYFIQLAFGPIETFPTTLTIGGNTYTLGTHYWVVYDDTATGRGPTSIFGLEWLATGTTPAPPVDASPIPLSGSTAYTYNRLPRDVEERARRWNLVGTDVKVHAAKTVYLRMSFAIMYDAGTDHTAVDASLQATLASYLSDFGFDASVQTSDLLQVAHSVEGIDNIRFLTSTEPTGATASYAIEKVDSTGVRLSFLTSGSPGHAIDLAFGDNEVPSLYGIITVAKAANTFSTF